MTEILQSGMVRRMAEQVSREQASQIEHWLERHVAAGHTPTIAHRQGDAVETLLGCSCGVSATSRVEWKETRVCVTLEPGQVCYHDWFGLRNEDPNQCAKCGAPRPARRGV